MERSKAKDAGGLAPVKDDNEAAPHFTRRTLLFFNCVDYKEYPAIREALNQKRGKGPA